MAKPTVAIVGLGVIGSSLGLALKKAGGNFEVIGHDREPSVSGKARKIEAVDKTSWNLINAVEGADLVLLAIPVSAIQDTLKAIAPYLKEGALVLDTAAVKQPVLRWADELLPATVSFVGGDPIVQTPSSDLGKKGPDLASADLFRNRVFCLCPSARTRPDAVQLASDLVNALGGQPYFLDPAEHDGLSAGVEHLPSLLAAALLQTVTSSSGWREMRKVAGETFARATDLPADGAKALTRSSISNADNLVRWIGELTQQLNELRTLLVSADEEELDRLFDEAITARERWLNDRARGFAGEDLPKQPEIASGWKSMFGMGGLRRKKDEQSEQDRSKRK